MANRPDLRAAPRAGLGRTSGPVHQSEGGPRTGAGAGHDATTPSEIPARGWWAIAKRVASNVSADGLMTQAAAITFYALLSLFPALAALVSIYGLFANPATIEDQLKALSGVVPSGGMQLVTDQVHSLTSHGSALSIGAVIGLVTSLWSANQGTKAMFQGLNVAYEEKEKRGFFRLTAITLAFTLGGILFVVIALAAVVAVPIALNVLGLGGITGVLLRALRWPALLVVIAILLACLYRIGPSREHARWRWLTWGSAFAAVAWVIVSLAFSWYVASFGSYNKTYGSLGAVVGFMTWIWLSATVVLVGAELNAEMEHQTARDTTTGPEKPRGARDATKADQVAPA
ncbi:MAG: YihY/virulence factor BrkB family protein [Acetobacteraceae bacterium]|nr:YihY/virulence factor BrkB family protein [Acetobacteraceae bacterium]